MNIRTIEMFYEYHASIALDSFWIWFNKWSPLLTADLYALFLWSVGSVSIMPETLSILQGNLLAEINSDSYLSMKLALTPNSAAID